MGGPSSGQGLPESIKRRTVTVRPGSVAPKWLKYLRRARGSNPSTDFMKTKAGRIKRQPAKIQQRSGRGFGLGKQGLINHIAHLIRVDRCPMAAQPIEVPPIGNHVVDVVTEPLTAREQLDKA